MESCFKFSPGLYMCIKSLLKIVLNKYPCFVNKWMLWWWQRLKVEAISGCLSVRRHARTCWKAARLIVRLWEVNEKTGNLLKFHFHPLRDLTEPYSKDKKITRGRKKINMSFISWCFGGFACVLLISNPSSSCAVAKFTEHVVGELCRDTFVSGAWLNRISEVCVCVCGCRRGVNDSWSSLSLSNFSGTAATSLKNITDTAPWKADRLDPTLACLRETGRSDVTWKSSTNSDAAGATFPLSNHSSTAAASLREKKSASLWRFFFSERKQTCF